MIGVMPDPAAKPTCNRPLPARPSSPKRPVGVITSSVSPAFNASFAQLENTPPSTRLIATVRSSRSGAEQME